MAYKIYRCSECGKGELKMHDDPSLEGKRCMEESCTGTMLLAEEVEKEELQPLIINECREDY